MAAAIASLPTLVTLEEYLHTSYEPDCDFVDGVLEERNVGGKRHGILQAQLCFWFISHQAEWDIVVSSEMRTWVGPSRVRLPDVAVLLNDESLSEQVQSSASFIAIEILSPDDRLPRVVTRLHDFVRMGVANVWVLDPVEMVGYTFTEAGLKLVEGERIEVAGSPVYLDLPAVFGALPKLYGAILRVLRSQKCAFTTFRPFSSLLSLEHRLIEVISRALRLPKA